jgi:hypothetical protein
MLPIQQRKNFHQCTECPNYCTCSTIARHKEHEHNKTYTEEEAKKLDEQRKKKNERAQKKRERDRLEKQQRIKEIERLTARNKLKDKEIAKLKQRVKKHEYFAVVGHRYMLFSARDQSNNRVDNTSKRKREAVLVSGDVKGPAPKKPRKFQ